MDSATGIARIAALLGDPARAAMLWTLIDGRARPAGELAFAANVSAQSASGHLAKLVESELLTVQTQGRHRYYQLASHDVALALESLAAIVPRPPERTLPASRGTPPALRYARTCYDHLAGELAVRILAHLEKKGCLVRDDKDYTLSAKGEKLLAEVGIEAGQLRQVKRRFACGCLDWSEREFHLGGALGAALLQEMLRRRWLLRSTASRVLQLTPQGMEGMREAFGFAA
jgi:DNA-binding transcriptional ArsR family regulator